MQIIIAYDIPENKRRERLRKALLRFGNPVQKSVFECDLSQRHIETMERTIRDIISKKEDNVRYYRICKSCAERVQFFGGKPIAKTEIAYVI